MTDITNMIDTVICGDCLEVMPDMPNNCVDLVITSPPYENARTYGIDFKLKGQGWVDWAVERFIECVRISRGVVAWVVEGKTEKFRWSATPALLMADLHRAGVKLRKPPAFYRVGIPGSGGPDWLRNDYEFIVCASKGKLPWSDNTACGHPPKWAPGGEMSHRISSGARVNQWGCSAANKSGPRSPDGSRGSYSGKPSHVITTKQELGDNGMRRADGKRRKHGYNTAAVLANPGNVIKCNVGGGALGSPLAHENEAPFPELLAERFIKSFCPPGGIVCDPFCGSGTSLAVAYKHTRHWLGIDVRQSQVDLSKKRIQEERDKYALLDTAKGGE